MPQQWVSPKKFAEISGLSLESVYSKAKSGELEDAVRVTATGRYSVHRDRALALVRGEHERGPAPPPPPSEGDAVPQFVGQDYQESAAAEKFWKAEQAKLDYLRKRGVLVDAEEVARQYADEATKVRTKLLQITGRLKQRTTLADADYALVDSMIREALAELSDSADI